MMWELSTSLNLYGCWLRVWNASYHSHFRSYRSSDWMYWNLTNSILLYKHNLHFKLSAYTSSETQCVHHPTEKDPEFGFRAFEWNTYGTESFRNFREGHFNRKCLLKTVSFSFYVSYHPLQQWYSFFHHYLLTKKKTKYTYYSSNDTQAETI